MNVDFRDRAVLLIYQVYPNDFHGEFRVRAVTMVRQVNLVVFHGEFRG